MVVAFFDWRNLRINDNDFIKELKEKREAYGVSQTKLAVACGISREHYNRIENGRLKPTEPLKQEIIRQMESYLTAQEHSWYDFMLDCMTASGVMKRFDLAVNDRTGILDIPKLKQKCRSGECISYFRKQKGYDGTEKNDDDIPKNTGETLYLGSTKSELYMCAYQKNYEQYVKNGTEIDGYRNFLFLNSKGYPMVASNYKNVLNNLVKKYNKHHEEPLPKITPHILRHTFCTRLAQKKMNPKNLQYIMGHSSITITLNLYAHASQTGANIEMRSLIA